MLSTQALTKNQARTGGASIQAEAPLIISVAAHTLAALIKQRFWQELRMANTSQAVELFIQAVLRTLKSITWRFIRLTAKQGKLQQQALLLPTSKHPTIA